MSKRSGFTLIELLIVISIIAILSATGMVAYANFLKTSRDNKRVADLKFIQSALEQYHSDKLAYPFAVTPGNPLTSGGKTYLTRVPNDPTGTPDYSYVSSGVNCTAATPENCSSYCLYAALEGTNRPPTDAACVLYSSYNYGITRP